MKGMINMVLKITAAAQEKIQKQMTTDQALLLDLNDGVGPFSKVGFCSLDTDFRLLIVPNDADLKSYPETFDSEMGPIHYKAYTADYFDGHEVLDLDEKRQVLTLVNNSGVVDNRVPIIVFDHEKITE